MKKFNEFINEDQGHRNYLEASRDMDNLTVENTQEYMCFWSKEAFTKGDQVELCSKSNFTEDMGYDQDDIDAIFSLKIGETWNSPDYHNHHLVTRVK